jgi:flagellin
MRKMRRWLRRGLSARVEIYSELVMGISLSTQSTSKGALKSLDKTLKNLSSTLGRLASGVRINSAADDAAGLAISGQLEVSIQASSRAAQNARDAGSALMVADGAVSQVQFLSSRMQELALQSANGVYSDTQRAALQQEFSSLAQDIQRISENTEFNGQKLLDGTELSVQVGTDGGSNSTMVVGGVNVKALASQLSSVDIGTQSGGQAAIDTVRQFSTDLANQRASKIGATYNRLEAVGQSLSARSGSESAALSAIRDVDFAQETAQLSKYQILSQAGISVLAQANSLNSNVLRLLQG